ncbi:serine/threonine protein kinase [Fusarium oxysporum f. sp. raphani 54005]|uniref:Serine/threonine protein kinase n=1 Tax=Fusarium oxysporum f. sp. raphani 54005 TaxID=1089458 RepID=X0BBP8_FUSOX|nr:serine/threonine protein kinase [Fusarium oxysporum f. sp. raphani 54005]
MSRSTRKDLPHHVRDFKITTRILDNRNVIHFLDDPEAPPFAPKLEQHWEREKHPVGRGGQGRVYLQTCTKGPAKGTIRAVKTLKLQQDNQRQRYVSELSTIARFSHQKYSKYFVKTLGYYESKTKLHIAMDYYPAGDLQDHIQNRPCLPEADVRQIISQVLAGLAVMHKQDYAHRDVKPKNILIQQHPDSTGSGSWWVKLADFGISKSLEVNRGNTSTIMGTPGYMAPELEDRAKRSNINFKAADMWALGVMAFFLSTKHDMFSSIRDVLHYEADPIRLFPNGRLGACQVSTDGQNFIRALTAPKPDGRPDSSIASQLPWIQTSMSDLPDIPDTGSE